MKLVPEAGALTLWKRELARNERTMYTADALRDAAILEAEARDDLRHGLVDSANRNRRAAAELLIRQFAEVVAA